MDELLGYVTQLIDYIEANGGRLSPETQQELGAFLQEVMQFISEYSQQTQSIEAPMPLGADLLWTLSGGKPDVFANYLRTVPDPALNALLKNPEQLNEVIQRLSQTMPQGMQETQDGIQHAPINSSNIYGFRYDPRSGKLLVRFQSGSVYGYEGVPPAIYKIFKTGAVPAKTNGKNQFGKWWIGKIPSLGAAFYELIRNGAYPYQRLK